MTTNPTGNRRRHPLIPSREDPLDMFHIEFRLAEAEERQGRLRARAERERSARPGRRRLRRRVGATFVRFGRTIGGDAMGDALGDATTAPAWQG